MLATCGAAINRPAHSGVLVNLLPLDLSGTLSQRRRALVLLVRECCRYAISLGIVNVRTEVVPDLRAFTEHLGGVTARVLGPNFVVEGNLASLYAYLLSVTDASGNG